MRVLEYKYVIYRDKHGYDDKDIRYSRTLINAARYGKEMSRQFPKDRIVVWNRNNMKIVGQFVRGKLIK